MSVEAILAAQRRKHSLPVLKLSEFLYTPAGYRQMWDYLSQSPVLPYDPNMYNKDRKELLKDSFRYLRSQFQLHAVTNRDRPSDAHLRTVYGMLLNPHQTPGTAHVGMFITYIELMGTEEHKAKYLQRARSYDIIGCYAQTEIGHGSDVRNLETEATFDPLTQEWVIDSPSLSAAKYWPGELSFLANYAIVFAQAIADGKRQGVFPFLVEIKDKEHNWLRGVEGGDIGPKIGFHAKENGWMLLHKVRVPKDSLLSKYVRVSERGRIEAQGDPRIGYGTMMHIRELISCSIPKLYAQVIIIAARYALFRRQFRDAEGRELAVVEYQLQQDKLLPRIAEYYAITVAGTRIRAGSERNSANLLRGDFSELQETHSNLAFSKCLFSELTQDGMEVLRRSLGGHGTSNYCGIPQIVNEYCANNTHEGENTVMYLQAARYVLKSYAGHQLKGKPLTDSVKYLAQLGALEGATLKGDRPWEVADMLLVLLRAIDYLLRTISGRMVGKKEGESETELINYQVGGRLQQLAQLHGCYYTLHAFDEAIRANKDPHIQPVVTDLCLLFGASQISKLGQPIVESGVASPEAIGALTPLREEILARLRPSLVGLLDSLAIPDKYIRSELAHGSPYNNFLDKARECEINAEVQESARLVAQLPALLAKSRLPLPNF